MTVIDWEERARPWITAEAQLAALHHNAERELLARIKPARGSHILEVGSGSGNLTIALADAVGAEGRVGAIDISPPFARRTADKTAHLPQVEVMIGDAQTYGFDPRSFDLVTSDFGVMFFSNPKAAFSNLRSSLRPSGRLQFFAWDGPKKNPWFSVPVKTAKAVIPGLPAPDPNAPGPMSLADTNQTLELLNSAGFKQVSVETVDLFLTPTGSSTDVAQLQFSIGRLPGLISQSGATESEAAAMKRSCLDEMSKLFSVFETADGVRIPASVHFYSGEVPG